MKHEKEKWIEEFYRLIWDSLESHLEGTHKGKAQKFDKECVKDYARMMELLTKIWNHTNKKNLN